MYSLIYISRASQRLSMAEVEHMAAQASHYNAMSNITGVLVFNGREFMQLLEGDKEAVLATMQRIAADERHDDIEIVRQEMREHRECADWAMRAQIAPFTQEGSASRFGTRLPETMAWDTRMLFTSFASSWRASAAAPVSSGAAAPIAVV